MSRHIRYTLHLSLVYVIVTKACSGANIQVQYRSKINLLYSKLRAI